MQVPSINQLKQSPFPVTLNQDPWAPVSSNQTNQVSLSAAPSETYIQFPILFKFNFSFLRFSLVTQRDNNLKSDRFILFFNEFLLHAQYDVNENDNDFMNDEYFNDNDIFYYADYVENDDEYTNQHSCVVSVSAI